MANCKNCGNELNGAKFCASCGTAVEEVAPVQPMPAQPVPGQPMPAQQMPGQPMPAQPMPGQPMPGNTLPKDNMGLAGFICGLVGFLCCTYVAIPGLICSILSMKNVKAGKVDPKNKWMGIVGLVLSILGLVIMVINIITMVTGANDVYNSIISGY